MHPAELSPSTQDYLKTIWRLGEWEPERVTTTSLAARMGLDRTVAVLMDRIGGDGEAPARHVLEGELIVRSSTRKDITP